MLQRAQYLGKKLGLDVDKDGDVDFLDLLQYLSQTKWGGAMGLTHLVKLLNESSLDPFLQINHRLDRIEMSTRSLGQTLSDRNVEPLSSKSKNS